MEACVIVTMKTSNMGKLPPGFFMGGQILVPRNTKGKEAFLYIFSEDWRSMASVDWIFVKHMFIQTSNSL